MKHSGFFIYYVRIKKKFSFTQRFIKKLSHFKNKFIILRYNFYYLKIALNCIGIKDKRLCRIKLGMKIASIINLEGIKYYF